MERFYDYDKAHDISDEIIAAINEQKGIDACDKVKEFMEGNPLAGEVFERLSSKTTYARGFEMLSEKRREANIKKLIARNNEYKRIKRDRPSRIRLLRIGFSAAASVAAVVLIGVFLFNKPHEMLSYDYAQTDYAQPVLVLDDHTVLDLTMVDELAVRVPNAEQTEDARLAYNYDERIVVQNNTLLIPSKFTYTLLLSDGTEVKLNAGSSLKYPNVFLGDQREVTLTGEAYFTVSESEKPFIINILGSEVQVYGTQFNVQGNPDGAIHVVLVEGRVGFRAEDEKEVILTPGEMVSYNEGKSVVSRINVGDYTAWVDDMFIFKDQPVKNILSAIAIWYGIRIDIGKNRGDTRMTLVIDRSMPLDVVLQAIWEIADISITDEDRGYYIAK